MEPIVYRGDITTLAQKSFGGGNRFVVSYPDSNISVRVYQRDMGDQWLVYRYIDYVLNPPYLPSNITYIPSSSLELLVMSGIGVEWLEEFAQTIRPGKGRQISESIQDNR